MRRHLFCFIVVSPQGEYGRSDRHDINASKEQNWKQKDIAASDDE
jgi:hypothetical protein